MKKLFIGLIVFMLLHSMQLFAGGKETYNSSTKSKFYVGFSFGKTEFDGDVVGRINNFTTLTEVNDDDTGFRFYGGVNLNKNFSVETGYADFGKFSSSYSGLYQSAIIRRDNESAEVSGFYVAAVGKIPLSPKVEVIGKLGFTRWSFEGEASIYSEVIGTDVIDTESTSVDKDGTDPLIGLGVAFKINKRVNVVADYTRYRVNDEDIDMFAIGVEYGLK